MRIQDATQWGLITLYLWLDTEQKMEGITGLLRIGASTNNLVYYWNCWFIILFAVGGKTGVKMVTSEWSETRITIVELLQVQYTR